ncbi:MAG TPA: hypothetical protein VLA93_01730 [Pyrinomonadaceae bacterium]|nr:hypothetical protein [Pyrinomonadaceae bacterium]
MKRLLVFPLLLLSLTCMSAVANAQDDAARDATREKLRQLLETAGQKKDVNTTFRQATRNPYNFVGTMEAGMNFSHVEHLEVVISVTKDETISFRIYPHYKGGYINIDKAKDPLGFAKKLLLMSDNNFMFWGIDDAGDAFAGYTFTLESGFPSDAIVIVLRSIRNTDKFVGELRPFFDGSGAGPATTHKGL